MQSSKWAERGHSCPQQLPNAQLHRNVQGPDLRSTLLRTRMSALRCAAGYGALKIPRDGTPYLPRSSRLLSPQLGPDAPGGGCAIKWFAHKVRYALHAGNRIGQQLAIAHVQGPEL